MRRVGVVVEGLSDLVFWSRLLGRLFSKDGYWFDVRSMKGVNRLLQEAPQLTDDFRKAGYFSAIFILDADKATCPATVLSGFDEAFLTDARHPLPADRFVQIFVAFRELESWLLADANCIRDLLKLSEYLPPTGELPAPGKAKLQRLCQENGASPMGLQNPEFARQAASRFDPDRAKANSPSFAYFWDRVTNRLQIPSA